MGKHGNERRSIRQGEVPCLFSVQCLPKLSASERGVYAASLSLLPQLSPSSNLDGSFTLKRPEGRAPTERQPRDARL